MQGWLNPTGPAGPATYWVRRALVVVVAVALVWSVVWALTRPSSVEGVPAGPASNSAAIESSDASAASQTGEPTLTQSSQPPEAAPETPATAEAPPPTPQEPPPPAACRANALSASTTGPDVVTAGQPATFAIALNTTEAQCVVNLAERAAALAITSGTDNIWATSSCPEWQPAGEQLLTAGVPGGFEVVWPGQRSNGCELTGGPIGAGTYVATVTLGEVSSRFVFQVA